jgi:hypothetical protein
MYISFSPQRRDNLLTLSKSGDVLTINGEAFDFSHVPDGATLPREAVTCEWLASDVEHIDGVIHLTLILPHGAQAPAETLFPGTIIAVDGDTTVPVHSQPEEVV